MSTLNGSPSSSMYLGKNTPSMNSVYDSTPFNELVGVKRSAEDLETVGEHSPETTKKAKILSVKGMCKQVVQDIVSKVSETSSVLEVPKKAPKYPQSPSECSENVVELPVVSEQEFIEENQQVFLETSKGCIEASKLAQIYQKYVQPLKGRSWSAEELRECRKMLLEIGFHIEAPVELNQMLPEGAKKRNGQPVEEANLFVWRNCAQQLGINIYQLYGELEATDFDKVKWSRRAKSTNGLQNKLARHNGCYTDLNEPLNPLDKPELVPDAGDVTQDYVRHKHPKNPAIKFTNFAFKVNWPSFASVSPKFWGHFIQGASSICRTQQVLQARLWYWASW